MKPYEFVNDLENRPKRKLKELKVVQNTAEISNDELNKKKLKEQEYKDTKLKNVLKIKLAGLMDLFKVRYKKFRKPIIDENLLAHLFEPSILENNPFNNYVVQYVRSEDPAHQNMIQELATGKYYYNMDLDLIEERLWNGYYSEPKQFLKDLKMIVKDCIVSGDRERILKANEMMTNAQFGVDDFSTPEFLQACKEVRERFIETTKLLEEHKKLQEEWNKKQEELQAQQQQQQQQQAAEEEVPNGVLPVAELMNGTTENANETDSKVVVENEPVIENEKTGNNTEDIIEIEQNVIPKEVNSPTKQAEVEIQEVETKISEDSNGKDVSMSVDDVDESESNLRQKKSLILI